MSFEGVYTAVITPFERNRLDFISLTRIVEQQVAAGIDGIVVCGTTGESATLSNDEIVEVTRLVSVVSAGACKVIAGIGKNSTHHSIELLNRIREVDVDGLLVITPYYNKPSQAGLLAHFNAIATSASDLPIMLYTVPSRTGVQLDVETFKSLCSVRNIVALKDATADLARSAEYVSAARKNVAVLSGDDITALPMWSVGGAGVVSVAGNICPRLMVAMWRAFRDGRQEEALRMHGRLLPLFRALFLESNPTPIKYLMAKQGLTSTYELRLPLVPVSADTAAQLDHCYDALEFDQ